MIKSIYIKSALLITILTVFILISDRAHSDTTTSQTISESTPISASKQNPLAMAHQQLDQAREHYEKGEISQVSKDLKAASKWLQGLKSNNHSITLANEIKQLQEKINQPSIEHENAILRLWHRSSALLERSVEQVTKSWKDSSTASMTMKQLIDARLYFSYAEHDIFANHNTAKATEELKNTLAYLDKAYEIAIPRVRKEISAIKKEIQQLPTSQTNIEEDKEIIQALNNASISIAKSSHSQNPKIQARSKAIARQITSLKRDIFLLEKQQQYDAIMKRLHHLDTLL
jgi:hypothetical protein